MEDKRPPFFKNRPLRGNKLLKSPNCTHVICEVLRAVVLATIVETLVPRIGVIVLRRTPIVEISKTTNRYPLQVHLI